MKLENYEVHLPNYSIGDKIYDKIGPVCESYGKKVWIVGGKRALKAAEAKIREYVAKTNLEIIGTAIYGEDCTYATVERLRERPEYREADMVFGVGQLNSMSKEELQEVKEMLTPYLPEVLEKNGVQMVFFMLTNIIEESTELLYYGSGAKEVIEKAFEDLPVNEVSCELKGVVSRKKQLIPAFMMALQNQ